MVGLVEAEQDLCAGRDVAQLRHACVGRANAARTVPAPLQVWQHWLVLCCILLCTKRQRKCNGGLEEQWWYLKP